MKETDLLQTTDAQVWAKEFVRIHGGHEDLHPPDSNIICLSDINPDNPDTLRKSLEELFRFGAPHRIFVGTLEEAGAMAGLLIAAELVFLAVGGSGANRREYRMDFGSIIFPSRSLAFR